MSTPVNGETFIPALLVEYLEAQRTALGLPTDLNFVAWPFLGAMTRPFFGIEATSFKLAGHPTNQVYDVSTMLDYGVGGDPAAKESAEVMQARLGTVLATENFIVSRVRAALCLRPGETITFDGSVDSLFTWAASRTAPAGEDYWHLNDFTPAPAGGSIVYDADKRFRKRITNYLCRFETNEFTPSS